MPEQLVYVPPTDGADGLNTTPHTSFTTGNVVGAVADETHSTLLLVGPGPPDCEGGVTCAIL